MPKRPKKTSLNKETLIDTLKLIADGIAGTFGPLCEVVIHDLQDLSCSIVKIANNRVTGRSVGGGMTDYGLKLLRQDSTDCLFLNYPTTTDDGKQLKSSTILFRDEDGTPVASLCMNFDVTGIVNFNMLIQEIFQVTRQEQAQETVETFQKDIGATIHKTIRRATGKAGKPVSAMKKEDRLKIVAELEKEGFFLIKGAINHLARQLSVSKFSIYSYLEEVRNLSHNVEAENRRT